MRTFISHVWGSLILVGCIIISYYLLSIVDNVHHWFTHGCNFSLKQQFVDDLVQKVKN